MEKTRIYIYTTYTHVERGSPTQKRTTEFARVRRYGEVDDARKTPVKHRHTARPSTRRRRRRHVTRRYATGELAAGACLNDMSSSSSPSYILLYYYCNFWQCNNNIIIARQRCVPPPEWYDRKKKKMIRVSTGGIFNFTKSNSNPLISRTSSCLALSKCKKVLLLCLMIIIFFIIFV